MSDPTELRDAVEVGFPFRVSRYGRLADPDYPRHVEEMIELVLFTAPGERVNRPEFGCGLLEVIFSPNDDAAATATQYLVRGALQRWLGDVVTVREVAVEPKGGSLTVRIAYTLLADRSERTSTFDSGGFRWSP
jgi:uncharacterized protein